MTQFIPTFFFAYGSFKQKKTYINNKQTKKKQKTLKIHTQNTSKKVLKKIN